MSNSLLSICVPTYNRHPYLTELVNELLKQIYDGSLSDVVEIIISDNASTDDSQVLFDQLVNHRLVKVYRLSENKGADYNFYNVASKARGDYIWWFCSDDLPEENALIRLVNILKYNEYALYYLGHNLYSKDMTINYDLHPYVKRFKQTLFSGISGAVDFSFMLGYIGAIIIKRQQFEVITNHLEFQGTNYVHVAWVMEIMLYQQQLLVLLKDSFIKHRLGNDSFLNNNHFNRAMIDVNGYGEIGKRYLSGSNFKRFYTNVFNAHLKGRFLSLARSSFGRYISILQVYYKFFWSLGIGREPRYLYSLIIKSPLSIIKRTLMSKTKK